MQFYCTETFHFFKRYSRIHTYGKYTISLFYVGFEMQRTNCKANVTSPKKIKISGQRLHVRFVKNSGLSCHLGEIF